MNPAYEYLQNVTRRHFLQKCHVGLGGVAFASLMAQLAAAGPPAPPNPLAERSPKLKARAKHVIFMHMAGGPSHLELFDYKPELVKRDGQLCPDEYFQGQRFAFIKGHPKLLGTPY